MTAIPKVHKNGPDELVVEADGKIKTPSGGVMPKVAKVALEAVDTAGGLFAWQNPESVKVLVTRLLVHLTTAAAAACTGDFGPAADATTLNDTGIDGLDLNAAAGLFDNVNDAGTNGKARFIVDEKGGTNDHVTGSTASGASSGIVGFAYIEYVPVG